MESLQLSYFREKGIFRTTLAYINRMNTLFTFVFLLCALLLACNSPENFLSALLDGAGKGGSVCLSLVATYSVWLGLMKVWEDSGVSQKISQWIKPLAKRLFKTDNEEALKAISMNLSVNFLGIAGAATPYGVKAARLLDKTENAEYSSAILFALNAASLQLIPTSIIAVRVSMQSLSPNDVVVPILLTGLFSALFSILLVRLFIPPKKSFKKAVSHPDFISKKQKRIGQV